MGFNALFVVRLSSFERALILKILDSERNSMRENLVLLFEPP